MAFCFLSLDFEFISNIDWSTPWFASWQETGQSVAKALCQGVKNKDLGAANANTSSLADALNKHKGKLSLDFIDQSKLSNPFTYEIFVEQKKCIPTRANSHDFFNGLSWIKFAKTKTAMLSVQAKEAGLHKVLKSQRGPTRDAMTVFDENGILLQADDRIWQALQNKDWQSLFITHRALWSEARVWLFGHALLEKLLHPRTAITGHVLQLKIPKELSESQLDDYLSNKVDALNWCEKPFCPLPVLGIPDWSERNTDPKFYLDRTVFRH